MISCTEFIPAYSELFKFLDAREGRVAVDQFWASLADHFLTNLRDLAQEKGLAGCFEYWSHSLTEEAADFRMVLDEENDVLTIETRYCPSMGRLLQYDYIEPYGAYCEHCQALYGRVLGALGFEYHIDLSRCNEAKCSEIIRKSNFKPSSF